MMFMRCFCVFLSLDFLYKSIYCGYAYEVDAIQMGIHNICLYKEDKKYNDCNLKTTQLLDSALIGVLAVIRLNKIYQQTENILNRIKRITA